MTYWKLKKNHNLSLNGSILSTGSVSITAGGVGADWISRSSGPNVVWHHNFDSAAEVNQFRWSSGYSGGNDPLGLGGDADQCFWVSTGGADGGGFMRLQYPAGANSAGSYWIRPYNPFTGATNGKGTNDPGASGTITPIAWPATDGSSTVLGWSATASPGYYGHSTDAAANPSAYQGNDFYIQVRVRRGGAPGPAPDAPPFSGIVGKSVWINVTVATSTPNEIVTYGQSPADVAGTKERHRMYEGGNRSGSVGGIGGSNETVTISNSDGVSDWRYSGGWDTLLYHVTPGTNGGTGSNRTRLEVWAQHDPSLFPEEDGQYTKIWDLLYSAVYGSGGNTITPIEFNGWNDLILAIYHNGTTFPTTVNYDYDQVIFSKATIPAPLSLTLPSWVPSTVGTWAEIPGTAMSSVTPSPLPNGTPASKFTAWTSFAIDRRNSRIYSVANGGHTDYAGNEVFDLLLETNTPGWRQLRASYAGPYTDGVDYYAANEPTSRHTYYGVTFDEFTGSGRIMLFGGAKWGANGPGSSKSDAFNLNSNSYSAAGTFPNLTADFNSPSDAFAACADTDTGDVYFWTNWNVYRWNRAANTLTTLVSNQSAIYARNNASAFDSLRKRFFIVGTDSGQTPHHTYTTGGTLTSQTLSGSAATAVQAASQAGMVYVPSRDSYLMRQSGSGGTVYEINASTFACTSMSTSGGASVPATSNGPFRKWLYAPRLKCVILCPTYTGNAWALRVE